MSDLIHDVAVIWAGVSGLSAALLDSCCLCR